MKLQKRYILKNINSYGAGRRLGGEDWNFIDLEYENGEDPNTLVTKRIYQHEKHKEYIVMPISDRYLSVEYLDLYFNNEDIKLKVEDRIDFYTEDELKELVESNKYPQDIPKLVVKVGLSAVTDPADWKYDYIANLIKSGDQPSKMAAMLAATLAARPEYTQTILPALQDTDGTIREYAAEMLGAIEQHTSS